MDTDTAHLEPAGATGNGSALQAAHLEGERQEGGDDTGGRTEERQRRRRGQQDEACKEANVRTLLWDIKLDCQNSALHRPLAFSCFLLRVCVCVFVSKAAHGNTQRSR